MNKALWIAKKTLAVFISFSIDFYLSGLLFNVTPSFDLFEPDGQHISEHLFIFINGFRAYRQYLYESNTNE
jgi:hypothetical protein